MYYSMTVACVYSVADLLQKNTSQVVLLTVAVIQCEMQLSSCREEEEGRRRRRRRRMGRKYVQYDIHADAKMTHG